jgi:hypothetical protein
MPSHSKNAPGSLALPRLNAPTQKSFATRFATRAVARTASGAITTVIGANISGVSNGAGGLNLGGNGIDDDEEEEEEQEEKGTRFQNFCYWC